MSVYYDCKRCEENHGVPMEFPTRQSFRNSGFSHTSLQCPITEKRALYYKDDLRWEDDAEVKEQEGEDV